MEETAARRTVAAHTARRHTVIVAFRFCFVPDLIPELCTTPSLQHWPKQQTPQRNFICDTPVSCKVSIVISPEPIAFAPPAQINRDSVPTGRHQGERSPAPPTGAPRHLQLVDGHQLLEHQTMPFMFYCYSHKSYQRRARRRRGQSQHWRGRLPKEMTPAHPVHSARHCPPEQGNASCN